MTTIASYVPPREGAPVVTHSVRRVGGAEGLWHHRGLVAQFTRREVAGRYRGSVLGIAWSLAHPLLMLAIYTFAFGFLWRVVPGTGAGGNGIADFALFAFAGMTVFGVVSETLQRAASCVVQNPSYVKKIVFPLETLPVVYLGTALVHGAVAMALLVVANGVVHGGLPWSAVLAPVALVPLVLWVMGGAWMLAAVGAYIRDVAQVTAVAMTALIYVSPVFYTSEMAETRHRGLAFLLRLNPLTVPLENFRAAILGPALGGQPSTPGWTVVHAVGGLALAILGYKVFQRAKRGFADVV